MALCLSRFYSNAAISASMSLRICAIAFCSSNPHSADTKANLGIKNLEKEKPEKID
jgi:hypothetical protein